MTEQGSILIVDDEQFIRQILVRTVQRAGFTAAEATDGLEALEKMAGQPFDMVITDIVMPNLDGYQLLGKIRESHPDMMVILISGQKMPAPGDSGDHRADAVISKPFHNVEITKKLHLMFQSRALKSSAGKAERPNRKNKEANTPKT